MITTNFSKIECTDYIIDENKKIISPKNITITIEKSDDIVLLCYVLNGVTHYDEINTPIQCKYGDEITVYWKKDGGEKGSDIIKAFNSGLVNIPVETTKWGISSGYSIGNTPVDLFTFKENDYLTIEDHFLVVRFPHANLNFDEEKSLLKIQAGYLSENLFYSCEIPIDTSIKNEDCVFGKFINLRVGSGLVTGDLDNSNRFQIRSSSSSSNISSYGAEIKELVYDSDQKITIKINNWKLEDNSFKQTVDNVVLESTDTSKYIVPYRIYCENFNTFLWNEDSTKIESVKCIKITKDCEFTFKESTFQEKAFPSENFIYKNISYEFTDNGLWFRNYKDYNEKSIDNFNDWNLEDDRDLNDNPDTKKRTGTLKIIIQCEEKTERYKTNQKLKETDITYTKHYKFTDEDKKKDLNDENIISVTLNNWRDRLTKYAKINNNNTFENGAMTFHIDKSYYEAYSEIVKPNNWADDMFNKIKIFITGTTGISNNTIAKQWDAEPLKLYSPNPIPNNELNNYLDETSTKMPVKLSESIIKKDNSVTFQWEIDTSRISFINEGSYETSSSSYYAGYSGGNRWTWNKSYSEGDNSAQGGDGLGIVSISGAPNNVICAYEYDGKIYRLFVDSAIDIGTSLRGVTTTDNGPEGIAIGFQKKDGKLGLRRVRSDKDGNGFNKAFKVFVYPCIFIP